MGTCKWCNEDKKLIRAHIYPRYFYEQNGYLMGNEYPVRNPIGIYDREILCEECDRTIFGVLDQYAKDVLIDKNNIDYMIIPSKNTLDPNGDIKIWLLKGDRHKEIIRFFISILWRAHVSNRKEFANVDLGKLENVAKQAISNSSFDFSKVFAVYFYYFQELRHKVNIMPVRLKMKGINLYIMIIGNFKVYIKCDSQLYLKQLFPLLVSTETGLLLIEANLKDHIWEHELLCHMGDILHKYLHKARDAENSVHNYSL